MKTYFWDDSGFKCPVCGGGSGHCGNWLTKTRLWHYVRAAEMFLHIVSWRETWPQTMTIFCSHVDWRDEPLYVSPSTAWEVSTNLWLRKL